MPGRWPSPATFGLLVSLLFALLPLMRARRVSAATPDARRRRRRAGGVALARLAADRARPRAGAGRLHRRSRAEAAASAGWFVLGAVGAFIAFPLLARGLMLAAARVGKPQLAALRLALANLHRPGSPTPIVMLSLGLGLTVLVATALIEGNLREQITRRIPRDAPAFFFVDIQSTRRSPDFEKAIAAVPGAGELDKVPSLRGRIVKIGGKPVNQSQVPPDARWAVGGDRGVTYSATAAGGLAHRGGRVVAGPTIAGRSSSPSTPRWRTPSASASATPSR